MSKRSKDKISFDVSVDDLEFKGKSIINKIPLINS